MARRNAHAARRVRRWAAVLDVRSLAVVALALVLAAGVAACGGKTTAASSPRPSGPIVLTVVGAKGTRTFTMAELKAMPAYQGYAGIKNSVGIVTPPVKWKGVRLADLTAAVGSVGPRDAVTVLAQDGYGMTFSYDQVYHSGFTAYDPATGNEQRPSSTMTMVLAYEHQGRPLAPDDEGPLRLVVAQPSLGQVVDGHWSVKWVNRILVKPATTDWSVNLQGVVTASITRQSYVSCASPGCHGSSYTSAGHTYQGVPLYLVVGLVDDANRHGAGAFNKTLAAKGYRVEIVSVNGKRTVLDSRLVANKNDLIVAAQVDGQELPKGVFPMRLVGPGLSAEQMVGRIVRIVLRLP
jgi:DMSO/TMAO reductase YedYZ molybdopterin-dependent catalytic subunit